MSVPSRPAEAPGAVAGAVAAGAVVVAAVEPAGVGEGEAAAVGMAFRPTPTGSPADSAFA